MSTETTFALSLVNGLKVNGIAFEDDGGQLRIPARHVDVGDLLITLDDEEITVFVGNFTHRHFTPHEGSATYAATTAENCVIDALEYISGILNDEWVLWSYPGGAGGSYRLGREDDPGADVPLPDGVVVRYLWSGPYDSRTTKSPERTREQ